MGPQKAGTHRTGASATVPEGRAAAQNSPADHRHEFPRSIVQPSRQPAYSGRARWAARGLIFLVGTTGKRPCEPNVRRSPFVVCDHGATPTSRPSPSRQQSPRAGTRHNGARSALRTPADAERVSDGEAATSCTLPEQSSPPPTLPLSPVPLAEEGHQLHTKPTLQNIEACKQLATICRTSLGPNGEQRWGAGRGAARRGAAAGPRARAGGGPRDGVSRPTWR